MTNAANAQQIEYWNGPVGERWARLQERIDLHLADITEAAIRFAAPAPGERILDIGCGCGTATLLLAMKAGSGGAAAGIDVSAPMLRVARARAMAQNAGVTFLQADASTYEFQPVFDLAFSRFGIMFFADPVKGFGNLRSALAPGGRLAFVCWRDFAENRWASEPMEAARPLLPPQEPSDPFAPGPFAFADAARLRGILERAGYASVEIDAFDGPMNMGASLEEAAAETLNIGPLARAATGLDDETREKIRAAVEAAYLPYASKLGVTLPAACWMVRARL
ncbi:MAG TPA: class I SAM-dependent methyltransferase [Rhizomicrobium sp.]|jgi:SAM-dependent methyltransferase